MTGLSDHDGRNPHFGVPTLVYYSRKRERPALCGSRLSVASHGFRALDSALFLLLAITVLVFGTLMALGPQALDTVLHAVRDVGVLVARRVLGRPRTNLSFLTWSEAARHNRWIISTAMALASMGLIPFLFAATSMARLMGAFGLFVGVALSIAYVPWPEAYGARVPVGIVVVLYAPILGLAVWHVLQYLAGHLRGFGSDGALTPRGLRPVRMVPAALALTMFVSPNYLSAGEAVVTRRLVCLDTVSGQIIWQADAFTTRPESTSAMNSYATPTPTVADDTIVAAFGPGLAAFSGDGRRLWSKMFPGWIEGSVYGAGSSPVIDEGTVFVTNDREYQAERQSQVIAYTLNSGTERWRQSPAFAHDGYATSLIHHDGERKLLLTLTAGTLAGYVASSGALAWRLAIPLATPIPSLVADGDRLYVTGGLSGGGYTAAYQLRPGAAPAELWTSHRSPADVSSPVLYKGRLFTITSTGVMVCYDADSGDVIWRHRVGSRLGVFYASLMAAGDKVYAVRSNGTTYVIAAEDRFRLIAQSSLREEIFASPALAADCLFLRTTAALYCIGSQTATGRVDVGKRRHLSPGTAEAPGRRPGGSARGR